MQKLINVKATKLKTGDIVDIAGSKHRIFNLTYRFGSRFESVSMLLRDVDGAHHSMQLRVCPKTRFAIVKRPNKK